MEKSNLNESNELLTEIGRYLIFLTDKIDVKVIFSTLAL